MVAKNSSTLSTVPQRISPASIREIVGCPPIVPVDPPGKHSGLHVRSRLTVEIDRKGRHLSKFAWMPLIMPLDLENKMAQASIDRISRYREIQRIYYADRTVNAVIYMAGDRLDWRLPLAICGLVSFGQRTCFDPIGQMKQLLAIDRPYHIDH